MKHDTDLANEMTAPNHESVLVPTGGTNKGVLFYQKSSETVFWLSFLTLNFYNIYWFYRQWRNIRDSTGMRCRPLGRAIFSIFYINQLAVRVNQAAQVHGNSPWRGGATGVSAAYLIAALVGVVASRMEVQSVTEDLVSWVLILATSLVEAYVLRRIQEAANYHNKQVLGADYDFKSSYVGKVYAGETVVTVLGVLFALIAVAYSVLAISTNSYTY